MLLDFMSDGGLLMWPLLIAGLFTIGAAARNVVTRGEGIIDPSRFARALFIASIAWSAFGLRWVCRGAHSDAPPRVFVLGIGEALTPAILGLSILAVVAILGSLSRSSTATV